MLELREVNNVNDNRWRKRKFDLVSLQPSDQSALSPNCVARPPMPRVVSCARTPVFSVFTIKINILSTATQTERGELRGT